MLSDRSLIVGQLYNGADTPPYSAGVDSGVNHPGVLSGAYSHCDIRGWLGARELLHEQR